jgi:hypothetical protein
MLGYRKNAFARAHALLQKVRGNLSDIATLREIQQLLFRGIMRAEQKIRDIKGELRSAASNRDEAALTRAHYLERRLEGVRQCAYIFRCFGDAIAFLYMDKHALKQTFYNTHNVNPKQDAGFLAGKEGLASEILTLESLLKQGVPALLSDLTNTIRHGDICVMVEPIPT